MALKVGELYATFGIDATEMNTSLSGILETCNGIAKKLVMLGLVKKVGDATQYVVGQSIEFESAFAGVRKTVDATETEYQGLSDSIKEMAETIPKTTTELAGIMEMGGQLAVPKENLEEFTETIAALSVSTNLTSEAAATMFAQFANITGMDFSNFDELGSVLVDLGNNSATTESAIMEMAMRIAAAGTQLGMSEADILAFSASLSSVGIEAEAGGTAFSKLMIKMKTAADSGVLALTQLDEIKTDMVLISWAEVLNPEAFEEFAGKLGITTDELSEIANKCTDLQEFADAVGVTAEEAKNLAAATFDDTARDLTMLADTDSESFKSIAHGLGMTSGELKTLCENADNLKSFAEVTGTTAEEFANLVENDPSAAVSSFINGLADIESSGGSAIVTLGDMGITEVRLRDSILRATNASDMMDSSIKRANTAWTENNALTNEAEQRYGTTESNVETLKNSFNNLCIEIGDKLTPALNTLADAGKDLCNWLRDAIASLDNTVLSVDDVQKIVSNFAMPETLKMQELATAKENSDALAESLTTLSEKLNNQVLNAKLKIQLDENESENFKETVEGIIETGLGLIEAQEYEVDLTLKTVMGEQGENYQKVSEELFKPFFEAIQAEADEAGTEARKALTSAMADGSISAEEAAKIQVLAQKYSDAVAQAIANVELKGELLRIQTENVGGVLDKKSINNIMKTVREQVENAAQTAETAGERTITLAYQAAAALELDTDATRRYIATIEQGINDQLSSIRLEGLNNALNAMTNTLEIPDMGIIYDETKSQLVKGFGGLARAIDVCAPELVESARNIYNAMEPDIEALESLRSKYEEAGMAVPQGIVDALNRADLLGAIGEGVLGIGDYLYRNFSETIDGSGELTEAEVRTMLAQIANVLYTDAEIPEAASVMWDGVFDTSLASIKGWQAELEIQLKAMGVEAGDLLGMALPQGVADGLSKGTMTVEEAAEAITEAAKASQSDIDAAATTQKEAGEEIGSATSPGIDKAVPDVEASASGLVDAAVTSVEPIVTEFTDTTNEAMAGMETSILDGQAPNEAAALEVSDAVVKKFILNMSETNGKEIGTKFVNAIKSAVTSCKSSLASEADNAARAAVSAASSVLTNGAGSSIGYNFAQGIANGIRAGSSVIRAAARSAAQSALSAAKSSLGIHSPSTVAEREIGWMWDAGLAKGVLGKVQLIEKAAGDVTDSLHDSFLVGDPSRGTVYTSGDTIRQTAKQTAEASNEKQSLYEKAEAIGRVIADRLIESGALDGDVIMDGDKVGEKVSNPVSRTISKKSRQTVAGRSAQGVIA